MTPCRYLRDGQIFEATTSEKLLSAEPFDGWRSLNLEKFANFKLFFACMNLDPHLIVVQAVDLIAYSSFGVIIGFEIIATLVLFVD